jgi:hypothetical protein
MQKDGLPIYSSLQQRPLIYLDAYDIFILNLLEASVMIFFSNSKGSLANIIYFPTQLSLTCDHSLILVLYCPCLCCH